MSKPQRFEKPMGMKDYLPDAAAYKRMIETNIYRKMASWGYREIVTPTVEFYETVGDASATMNDKMFKLLDRHGHTLVLRPDMTAPIARVAASLLKEEPLPLRLMYQANVFRAQEEEAGRNAEFYQMGAEMIGERAIDADAEMIALAVDCLRATGISSFIIAVGHHGWINGMLSALPLTQAQREYLKTTLLHRNYVAYSHALDEFGLGTEDKDRLAALLTLRGGLDAIEQAERLVRGEATANVCLELRRLWALLTAYQVAGYVMIDLSFVGHMGYYSGVVFEGMAEHVGFPVLNGGRYDDLMVQFGRPAAATGFALKTDRIMEASSLPHPTRRHHLVLYDEASSIAAVQKALDLRENGNVAVELRRLDQHKQAAGQTNADVTVIRGGE